MARPGVVVTSRAEIPPRSAPTDAGMAFLVGATATGDSVEVVTSKTQYEDRLGARTGSEDAYDAAEAFFREGGTKLTVARVTGGDEAAALANLTSDLGPGQVFMPGAPGLDATNQAALLAFAAATNRIALIDGEPDATAAELVTLAGTLAGESGRYGAIFAPAAIIPGLTAGSTRTVPYSAIQAGIISRNDARYSPNVPAAGINGLSRAAIDLTATFTDAERETLNEAGVNVVRMLQGQVETYGYRTLAPDSSGWLSLASARLNMEIVAKAQVIGERYIFAQIDGRGVKISQFGAELTGMLVPYYEAGSLYGDSPDEAFFVDVGSTVNTDESLAAGELHAVLGLHMSPFAEMVVIEIVKIATGTPILPEPEEEEGGGS